MKASDKIECLLLLASMLIGLIALFVEIVAVYRYASLAIGRWAGITFLVFVIAGVLLVAVIGISETRHKE